MPIAVAFFLFFIASGFCSLMYEVVWTRLAMAQFGVTSTVISVVLSVFMLGLALGSWLAGSSWLRRFKTGRDFLRAYAVAELAIGTGAVCVPALFIFCRSLLLRLGESNSLQYHVVSALLLAISILPWTTAMGTTFALAMGAMRSFSGKQTFSYLYLANVLGAAAGTLCTALVLVELLGFRRTLFVAAALNALVFSAAWLLARKPEFAAPSETKPEPATELAAAPFAASRASDLTLLFVTGFASMGMEVCWTRLFMIYIGTFVYAFAAILAVYLIATYLGSLVYRSTTNHSRSSTVWALLGLLSLLPLIYADERLLMHKHELLAELPLLALSIFPFCAALGYVTPLLVDRYGGGRPELASRAYAVNVVGCILGPLAAGYILLPWAGERGAVVILALFPIGIGIWAAMRSWQTPQRKVVLATLTVSLLLSAVCASSTRSYVETLPGAVVRRDHTATVVAYGEGANKRLLVNGVGITALTNITKVMAHLPLALLARPAQHALAICFGMGTTFRSLASWNIDTTAVDLVPSVPAVFGYFFSDAAAVLARGNAHVVIDDGRRFLDRTRVNYDVITIDPPPPVEAAGSSLLYSREFYQALKRRLTNDGILQQWIPKAKSDVVSSVAQSINAEFPYVRVYGDGNGFHFLASRIPVPKLTAKELFARLPADAKRDLNEWGLPKEEDDMALGLDDVDETSILSKVIDQEIPIQELIARAPQMPELTDARPVNEYFLLRELRR